MHSLAIFTWGYLTCFVRMRLERGVVDWRDQRKTRFVEPVSLAMQFEANTSMFFAVFDCLVVVTECSDPEKSRSVDFRADRR